MIVVIIRQGRIALLLPIALLAACQPQLKSNLPMGQAAYDVLEPVGLPHDGAYRLRAGDVIDIAVFQEPDLSQQEVAIDAGGFLYLPLIGEIRADGFTQAELSQTIEQAYARDFLRAPQVAVIVKQALSSTVSVDGEVEQPGVYPIQPDATLISAIALARSTTRTAKLDEVLVFRIVNGERMGARFDLTEIRAGNSPNPRIYPGDIVVIGYSRVRGFYRDILETAPLFNVFTRF